MNKATNVLIFVLGAAVGSVVTWQYVKNKYERIAQEEIDSVKEVFLKREPDVTVEVKEADVRNRKEEKPGVVEYAARLQKEGYTNYAGMNSVEEVKVAESPYVISPEEFGEFDEYEKISLTYYADQVLADENDELVDDVDDVIGFESLTHFGEYEDDSVFVRNDRLKCDYEILMDSRLYSDVVKTMPHRVEV
ncbi:MAG: hypothetical protein KH921_07040 [Erysipelotrichaceae bacterium]|nr:hypothetical protein [Erysipelotrichaceae bacterium]